MFLFYISSIFHANFSAAFTSTSILHTHTHPQTHAAYTYIVHKICRKPNSIIKIYDY